MLALSRALLVYPLLADPQCTMQGDMVGLGVENWDRDTCRAYVSDLRPAGGLTQTMQPWQTSVEDNPAFSTRASSFNPSVLRSSYPFGQISDDTQCSRELAASIIAAGRFSVVSFCDAMVQLHKSTGVIGQGPTSEATLDKLANGASWFEGSGGEKSDALTNGSIMRVGPIGLLSWRDP
jgi:ADP-ribosylglycohydrolase